MQAYQKRALAVCDWLGDLRSSAAHPRAPGEGRVLGRRGQARAAARHARLSGVHAQGRHRRLLCRLRARAARGAGDDLPGVRHAQLPHGGHDPRAGERATQFEFQKLLRHGRRALRRAARRASGRAVPRLCAGRQLHRSAALPRAPAARERRQHLVRPPDRRSRTCRWRSLVADPLAGAARALPARPAHPAAARPVSATARNSLGLDLVRPANVLDAAAARRSSRRAMRTPLTPSTPTIAAGARLSAIARAADAHSKSWSRSAERASERAAVLERAADRLEARMARAGVAHRARGRPHLRRRGGRSARGGRFLPLLRPAGETRCSQRRSRWPARPANATSSRCTAAACSPASARGISRSPSSPARSPPRWPPATR